MPRRGGPAQQGPGEERLPAARSRRRRRTGRRGRVPRQGRRALERPEGERLSGQRQRRPARSDRRMPERARQGERLPEVRAPPAGRLQDRSADRFRLLRPPQRQEPRSARGGRRDGAREPEDDRSGEHRHRHRRGARQQLSDKRAQAILLVMRAQALSSERYEVTLRDDLPGGKVVIKVVNVDAAGSSGAPPPKK